MSLLAEDASEFEGAFKKKEFHNPVSRHKKDDNGDDSPALPSAKSGWGTDENGVVPKKKEEPATVGEYNWDSEDEVELAGMKPEEVNEELVTTVADAPRHLPMMQTIKELDKHIKFSLPSVVEAGVDMSVLTAVLNPYEQVVEKDITWEFDSLFVKISAELQAEYEAKERENEEREKEKENEDDGSQPGRA